MLLCSLSHTPELSPEHRTSAKLIVRSWVPEKNAKTFASHLCPLKCLTFYGSGDTKAKSTFSSFADKSSNLAGLQEDRTYITLSLCPSGEVKCSFLLSCG